MKGYWLILGEVIADEQAQADYVRLWGPVAAKYQARLVSGAGQIELVEKRTTGRVVLVEFPDLASARACLADPEYQTAATFARKASQRELLVFEGTLS